MDDIGEDAEARALAEIVGKASRFKLRVVIPCVVLGTLLGLVGAVLGAREFARQGIAFGFAIPFSTGSLLALGILRVRLPRKLGRWIVEAAESHGVSKRALIELARPTLMRLPTFDVVGMAKASHQASRIRR